MGKDASATPANQAGDPVITRVAGRKSCIYMLLLGAILGMMMGILNLAAINNSWTIQNDFFDIADAPIKSFMPPRFVPRLIAGRGPNSGTVTFGIRAMIRPNGYSFHLALVIISYLTFIGLFLASLFCLVCTGVDRDIVRDRVCRFTLFFGACAGICLGSLSFLAASNGWNVLSNCFDSFNRPVNSLIDTLQNRYRIMDSLPRGPQTEFIFRNTAVVIYWTVVCLFLASIYCVTRILMKRKSTTEIPWSEE